MLTTLKLLKIWRRMCVTEERRSVKVLKFLNTPKRKVFRWLRRVLCLELAKTEIKCCPLYEVTMDPSFTLFQLETDSRSPQNCEVSAWMLSRLANTCVPRKGIWRSTDMSNLQNLMNGKELRNISASCTSQVVLWSAVAIRSAKIVVFLYRYADSSSGWRILHWECTPETKGWTTSSYQSGPSAWFLGTSPLIWLRNYPFRL